MKLLTISAALAIALSSVVVGEANAYTFTNIGNINGASNLISFSPVINNSGTVAFQSFLNGGGAGIFTSNGDSLTSIVDSNIFSRTYGLALNDEGIVAFAGELNDGGYVNNVDYTTTVPAKGIFTSNGTTTNTIKFIPRTTYPWNRVIGFDTTSINNEGTVVFTQVQKPSTTILTSDGMTLDQTGGCESFTNPLINNVQTITYLVDYCANGSAIIKNDKATKTIIADTKSLTNNFGFLRIGDYSFNNQGIAAFNTITYAANGYVIGNGIYTSDGNTKTAITNINDSFSELSTPSINDA